MSVVLYKDGGSQLFPIDRFRNALENGGWRLSPEPELNVLDKGETEGDWPKSERLTMDAGACVVMEDEPEPVAPTREQADTNKTGKLSPQETRAAARTAGIEDFAKARIATLKTKLGYDN